ncbi:hypothetical protein B0H10DRAFT_2198072 [Mycena sp. CBHHK59/15]|nr:hypothetical protein B0H10DRAFT_2198072 [Mycena sp. CBHHK59/15]
MDSGLVTQFTEDLISAKATVCGRSKCPEPHIAAGEPRHYIAGYNSREGKFVCGRCIEYYKSQPATMSRQDAGGIIDSQAGDVRKSVNDARKKGASLSTRRVTPVPAHVDMSGHSRGQMLPPPLPPQGPQPRVSIPNSWNRSPLSYPPPGAAVPQAYINHSTPTLYGYSAAHSQYAANRQMWASRAYQSSIADTITLRFKVLHEVPGKPNGAQVRNLSEGKPNVLATSTPDVLRQLAIDTMEPKEPSGIPYFYDRCLTGKPKGKDGVNTFKKPTKAFELALVIDADQWEEIGEYLAQRELAAMEPHPSHSVKKAVKTLKPRTLRSSTKKGALSESKSSDSSSDSEPSSQNPLEYRLNQASFDTVRSTNGGPEPVDSGSRMASKRRRSDSHSIPKTPPRPKRRAIPVYESPNRDQLRDALLEGGSSFSQASGQDHIVAHILSEHIEFYQIVPKPLQDLISSGKFQGFTCEPANAAQGSLRMEDGRFLGIGTFKTAHPGYLTLVHLAMDGLGTKPNEDVAVKRMYVPRSKPTDSDPKAWVINRRMPEDEFRKILMEANVFQWAISIMTFTYSFIEHFLEKSPNPPPFPIPEICFVHAGVALVHQQDAGPLGNKKATICRSYLIEEEHSGFYKFINNGSAVPVPLPAAVPSLSALAEFLAFTQHVQYYKSGGMVYLSDLQGTVGLLTDPQIMTAPSIGDGIEIFGEGNVPAAFSAFPMQHVCNKFCHWFQLPVLQQGMLKL